MTRRHARKRACRARAGRECRVGWCLSVSFSLDRAPPGAQYLLTLLAHQEMRGPALNDFGKPIVEHDCVALDEPRSKRDLRAIDPHFGADRLARENRRCEAQTHAFEARGIVSCDRLQQRAAGDSERAEAM